VARGPVLGRVELAQIDHEGVNATGLGRNRQRSSCSTR
jgi:hypothetical protein